MIVFWRNPWNGRFGQRAGDWRVYKGRVKLRNGFLHIYPCNGRRAKLSSFIAFNDSKFPPHVFSAGYEVITNGVDVLVKAGEVAAHLPATYMDARGNIRRMDSTLSLVLEGPSWGPLQEEEFQDAIALPF